MDRNNLRHCLSFFLLMSLEYSGLLNQDVILTISRQAGPGSLKMCWHIRKKHVYLPDIFIQYFNHLFLELRLAIKIIFNEHLSRSGCLLVNIDCSDCLSTKSCRRFSSTSRKVHFYPLYVHFVKYVSNFGLYSCVISATSQKTLKNCLLNQAKSLSTTFIIIT